MSLLTSIAFLAVAGRLTLFDIIDVDKNDKLTRAELDRIVSLFDANGDGRITPKEFETDWVSTYHLGPAAEARALFTIADATHDGLLTNADSPFIFQFLDTNGDGLVDLGEFLTKWEQAILIVQNPSST